MISSKRETVHGWRWDFITPWGWMPSSGVGDHYGIKVEPQGWWIEEQAVCLVSDHHAPNRDCACGLHGVEYLSEPVAERLETLDTQRNEIISDWVRQANGVPLADGRVPASDVVALVLSRVVFEDVLPTAWPDDDNARAAHPAAFPDPPHTIRAHRRLYREIFVDREWPAVPGTWPAAIMPEDGVHYVPNLADWALNRVSAAGDHDSEQREGINP